MKIISKGSAILLSISFLFSNTTPLFAATAVSLGSASNFAVLAGSTITNTGSSVINGSLGLSPGTSVTGFPPGLVNASQEITTPVAAQAKSDLVTTYNAASAETGAVTVSGDLGGQTLVSGVYNSASSLGLTGTLILDGAGDPNAVFVFQMGSTLTTASGSNVSFVNGAQACNVYWQVGSSATLGTNSNFSGTILALASITLNTGADVTGRVLARNGAVTLDDNTVTIPSCTVAAATSAPTATSTPIAATSTPVTATSTLSVTTATSTLAVVVATTTPVVIPTPPPFIGVTSIQTPGIPTTGGHSDYILPLLILSLLFIAIPLGLSKHAKVS